MWDWRKQGPTDALIVLLLEDVAELAALRAEHERLKVRLEQETQRLRVKLDTAESALAFLENMVPRDYDAAMEAVTRERAALAAPLAPEETPST